ncbi:ferrous iron transport protein A [Ectothiorhodospiraceae bacterium BW-2]|nr:ferrous iron transport protein A [Ectothiorhodospiraceae bacterium BW-2]
MSEQLTQLSKLKPGQRGQISAVEGEKELRSRLAAMGFRKGAKVSVGHSALFGDPRTYTLGSSHISLRNSEAQHVQIQLS